jgi:hypothetical protein
MMERMACPTANGSGITHSPVYWPPDRIRLQAKYTWLVLGIR